MKLNYLLIILIAGLFECRPMLEGTKEFVPSFSVSKKTTHKISEDQDYTFGYMKVLENRDDPNSRVIQFPVYIFKSRNPNPKPDPVIYTVGGPGSTSMPSAQYMKYYQYLNERDLILVEQRGNLYAKPHLGCPEWAEAQHKVNLNRLNTEEADVLLEKAALLCRERLIKDGVDLNGYNTREIAADINDLVNALNLDEYNLLTISYSTKIAQVLMRDYPDKIRSVVMDSPLPLEVNYDEESITNLIESVNALLLDCEEDESCNKAFPNLKKHFFDYLKEKTETPLLLNVEHPESKVAQKFYLTGADFLTVFTSASTGDVANIPFEINKLLREDYSSVKAYLQSLFSKPGRGSGLGMRLSVWCSEENPFNSKERISMEENKYLEVQGLSSSVFNNQVCNIWSVESEQDLENQSVKSDIPVLLINGEYDNETPVKWAKAMMNNLSNSHHLIYKGWKHTPTTNWGNPCAMRAANEFFNNPKSKPEPECFDAISGPEFRIK